jgi:hypothetical protein
MFERKEIISDMAKSVEALINSRNYHCMSFFLPTDGEERVECINPVLLDGEKYKEVDKLIEDLKNNFSV